MNNLYYKNAIEFKKNITYIINKIFSERDNKLSLFINNIILLEDEDNCIKSSTAIGYCLEEFIIRSFLNNEYQFDARRETNKGTQNCSYDFYVIYNNEKFLVNIKGNKVDSSNNKKGSNNAVAAIERLYNDYTIDENIEKHFFILKIDYKIKDKIINIVNTDGYFLEEIDFSNGYKSDSRNWSLKYKSSSARLQISKNFYDKHKLSKNKISFELTKQFIIDIFKNKIKRI